MITKEQISQQIQALDEKYCGDGIPALEIYQAFEWERNRQMVQVKKLQDNLWRDKMEKLELEHRIQLLVEEIDELKNGVDTEPKTTEELMDDESSQSISNKNV